MEFLGLGALSNALFTSCGAAHCAPCCCLAPVTTAATSATATATGCCGAATATPGACCATALCCNPLEAGCAPLCCVGHSVQACCCSGGVAAASAGGAVLVKQKLRPDVKTGVDTTVPAPETVSADTTRRKSVTSGGGASPVSVAGLTETRRRPPLPPQSSVSPRCCPRRVIAPISRSNRRSRCRSKKVRRRELLKSQREMVSLLDMCDDDTDEETTDDEQEQRRILFHEEEEGYEVTSQDGANQEEPWIEATWHDETHSSKYQEQDEHDDEVPAMGDLFSDPDPEDVFVHSFHLRHKKGEKTVTVKLRGIKAENGQTLSSTGLTLWRAAVVYMCPYLVEHVETLVRGKRVLELGAGLGMCGILAHKLGAKHVLLTDGDTDTLHRMRSNVLDNKTTGAHGNNGTVICRQLRWGNDRDMAQAIQTKEGGGGYYDVVMGSDVAYVEEMLDPLFQTAAQVLRPSDGVEDPGKFVMAYARRNVSIDIILETAARHGFGWTRPMLGEGDANIEGVYIFTKCN